MEPAKQGIGLMEAAILKLERRQLSQAALTRSGACLLLLVTKGSLTISVGALSASSPLMFCYAKEPIRFLPAGSCEYLLLKLDPSTVLSSAGCGALLRKTLTEIPYDSGDEITVCMRELEGLKDRSSRSDMLSGSAALLRIFSCLAKLSPGGEAPPPPVIPLSERRRDLYLRAMSLILAQGEAPLPLKDAASALQLTPQYLGSFLKETSGMSYRQLLYYVRMSKESLLQEFSNSAQMEEDAPGRLLEAQDTPSPAGHTGKKELQLNVLLDPVRVMPKYGLTLINLGYAANLRSLDMEAALDLVQSEIGFQAGRICRITDLITTHTLSGRSVYNFSAVFSLLDALILRGITPFLELGNKSFLIQETTTLSYAPISPTDSREYYQQLLHILPDFARACINHFGQSSFDSWYFEIGFMYTSDEEREKFGLVQYAAIFRKIYRLLRGFSARCRIGGPGFNDWSDPAKIRQMVRLMTSEGIVPDFFSAYIYPVTEDSRGFMRLSENPDEGILRMRTFAEAVRAEHPGKEIWITEYNSNLSSRNHLNDAPYQAAYIIKMMLGAYPLNLTAIGYYLLSDAPLRYLDSLDFLFGGWGLLTDQGLPKQSFYAYRLLRMMGHYLIRIEKNCVISANSRGSFQILLCRYQHPKGSYLLRNVEKEDLLLPEAVFEDTGSDHYRIRIRGVLKGTYIVREYQLDDTHTNLYAAWEELDFLYPPNALVMKELRQKSALLPEIHVRKLDEGQPFIADLTLRGTQLRLITVNLYASHT